MSLIELNKNIFDGWDLVQLKLILNAVQIHFSAGDWEAISNGVIYLAISFVRLFGKPSSLLFGLQYCMINLYPLICDV